MSAAGKPRGPYHPWTPEDLALARKAMDEGYGPVALKELFPDRSEQALRNICYRIHREPRGRHPEKLVKAPGDYIETLACYLVEHEECMRIWLDWNGYVRCRKLSQDRRGWVTLLCTAK